MSGIFSANGSKNYLAIIALIVVVSSLFFIPKALAIFVAPTEVFFEKGQRSATITVSNRAKRTKLVTFSWQRKGMTENGKMVFLEGANDTLPRYRPVDPYIKLSPRRLILKPGQNQIVRILLQKPADLESGEYRSHLFIQEDNYVQKKPSDNNTAIGSDGAEDKSLSGNLSFIVSRAIPIFMRHGETDVNVTLHQASLIYKKERPRLQISFTNDSTRSIYGQIQLACTLADNTIKNMMLTTLRIYAEAKNFDTDVAFAKKYKPEECVSMAVKIVGKKDRVYGGQDITKTIDVQL